MTKVLYIAGWGRSGTTILDNLLGQVDGFTSTGELHYVWSRGLGQRRSCGCGSPLPECPFWREVFAAGFDGIDRVDVASVLSAQRRVRTRRIRTLCRQVQRHRMLDACDYAPFLHGLYRGVAAASGASVVVDSSKFPADAVVGAGLPGVEVFVVHMVRDPRAVAHSWQRRKPVRDKAGGQGLLRRVGMVRSAAVWQLYNAVIARQVRSAVGSEHYLRLPYERLTADPQGVIRELVAFVGGPDDSVPRFDGGWVELAPSHTASGNPVRFAAGRTLIKSDDDWVRAMPAWRKAVVTAMSSPMLTRMGYGLKGTTGGAATAPEASAPRSFAGNASGRQH